MNGRTGFGVSVWQRNREIYSTYSRLKDGATVYQAELFTMKESRHSKPYTSEAKSVFTLTRDWRWRN